MKYWAFLSYSHRDRKSGDWLHKALETYRVPHRLVGKNWGNGMIPRRLFPIFRDREELPVSADLGSNITAALQESRYLIVICSPAAAQSRWVAEEIRTFKQLGREDQILALIVDGEPNATDGKPGYTPQDECFPEPMRYRLGADGELSDERTEPIAADARADKDGRNDAKLKLVAGLLGISYDELKQREQRRVFRRRLLAALSLVLAAGLIGGIWMWQEISALHIRIDEQKRRAALQQEQQRVLNAKASDGYVKDAVRDIENFDFATALARLAAAVRWNPQNHGAAFRLMDLMQTHQFWIPLAKPLQAGGGAFVTQFSSAGKSRVLTSNTSLNGISSLTIGNLITGETSVPPVKLQGKLIAARFNGDGSKIVTVDDRSVAVWDGITGRLTSSLRHYPASKVSAAISPDASVLALARSISKKSSVVEILQTETGTALPAPHEFTTPIMRMQISRDSSKLLILTQPPGQNVNASVLVWSISEGKVLWGPSLTGVSAAEPLSFPNEYLPDLSAAALSSDGQHVICQLSDRVVELRDASTGKVEQTFQCDKPLAVVRLSPNGETLIAVETELDARTFQSIHGWTTKDGKTAYVIDFVELHGNGIYDLVWSADSSMFVELAKGIIRSGLDGHAIGEICDRGGYFQTADFSTNGEHLLMGIGTQLRPWHLPHRGLMKTTLLDGEGIATIAGSEDGDLVAAWSTNLRTESSKLWLLDGKSFQTTAGPVTLPGKISECQFSPDHQAIAVMVDENSGKRKSRMAVLFLDGNKAQAMASKLIPFPSKPYAEVKTLAWNKSSSKVALTSSDDLVVCDLAGGTTQHYHPGLRESFMWAQFSPDSNHLYILNGDGVSKRSLVTNAKPVQFIRTPAVLAALSPDGSRIATAGTDGTIRLWRASDGTEAAAPSNPLGRQLGDFTSLSLYTDNFRLAATTGHGTLRIWDAATSNGPNREIGTARAFQSVSFIEKDLIMTVSNRNIDFWDYSGNMTGDAWDGSGNHLGGMEISGDHPQAQLCGAGDFVLFIDTKGEVRVRRMPGRYSDVPAWLADLAEATSGWHVNDGGVLESVQDTQTEKLEEVFERIRSSPTESPLKDWAMTCVVP